ncbi:MAG: hypothetical protein KTR15_02300 [Phycisphaeraceae bacterium]|nr:hypothetical protein [Phycisphaeraceae bacterium]
MNKHVTFLLALLMLLFFVGCKANPAVDPKPAGIAQARPYTYNMSLSLQRYPARGDDAPHFIGTIVVNEMLVYQDNTEEYLSRAVLRHGFKGVPGKPYRYASTVGQPQEDILVEIDVPVNEGDPVRCTVQVEQGGQTIVSIVAEAENGGLGELELHSPIQLEQLARSFSIGDTEAF